MWTYQHTHFLVHQIPALRDNYIYIIQDYHSKVVCVVDPTQAGVVQDACQKLNLKPTHILNTHHHWDHTDGNLDLIQAYQCAIIGNQADASRIPGISQPIKANSSLTLGQLNIRAMDVPGHTLGHIAFIINDALFCGDTLFGAGCGRLFEGSHAQMWQSLQTLAALDEQTKIYCAHEYTLANLSFAQEMDSGNEMLQQRIQQDKQTRLQKKPTIPSHIGLEKQTNPFLRPLNAQFLAHFNQRNQQNFTAFQAFKAIRQQKDKW